MHAGGACDIGQKVAVMMITDISISGGYRKKISETQKYEIKLTDDCNRSR